MQTATAFDEREAVVSTFPQGGRRPWSRRVLHWLRRLHLFTGLFMLPWVVLYGATALLFNHPGVFADQERRTLDRAAFVGTELEELLDPGADARQVVDSLNARLASLGKAETRCVLVEEQKAAYTRDRIVARVRGDGQEHSVLFDLNGGTASVGTVLVRDEDRAPFAARGLKVPGSLGDRVRAGLPKAIAGQGFAAGDASISIGSDLVFFVEVDGQRWRASYSPQSGSVSARRSDGPKDFSTRRFLTQMHLSHGFPASAGARWVWALFVDLMCVSMLFWGPSGLVMWWQIKAVRLTGAVVLASSVLVAALLAAGMHQLLGGP